MLTPDLPSNPALRQKAVAFALALVNNTHLEPDEWERMLLRRFEAGELSLDEVETLLEAKDSGTKDKP